MRARLRVTVEVAIIASAIRSLMMLLMLLRSIGVVVIGPSLLLLIVVATWLGMIRRIVFQCCVGFVIAVASSHVLR